MFEREQPVAGYWKKYNEYTDTPGYAEFSDWLEWAINRWYWSYPYQDSLEIRAVREAAKLQSINEEA